MATVATRRMTTAELLAMPDDGVDRDLIRGEVRERGPTIRDRFHAATQASIVALLGRWLVSQPKPRGELLSGGVGCVLRHDPDSTVGIDVAYFSADVISRQTDDSTMVDGPPVLAIEILSPSDKQEEISEKIDEYLATGVALVWIVDPHFQTITVHRADAKPKLFNADQQLIADPHLPGLTIAVKAVFE